MGSRIPTITEDQMRRWRAMESEHTSNVKGQERIVMQHVKEHGTGYYPALKKMESHLPHFKK